MITEAFLSSYMRRQTRRILAFAPAKEEQPLPPPQAGASYLLYLHVPFCEQLCPYCSFNRIRFEPELAREYFRCLRREMNIYHDKGYRFDSIYMGGGTPTILPAELECTLRLAKRLWPVRSISVETNPNHLTPVILDGLEELGVNRVSVGVQSFDDRVLQAIGRYRKYGSGEQIKQRLAAVEGRFETLNIDLIFNFPMQTEESVQKDLEAVKALRINQVTFYPLMAAGNTWKRIAQRGAIRNHREKRFYRQIREALEPDYRPSSAWCFSLRSAGRDAAAELIDEYIMVRDQYAGLGSGSFGYLQGRIYANTFSIPRYIERLGQGSLPIAAAKRFSPREQLRYDFLMRLFRGRLDTGDLERKHGRRALQSLGKELLFLRATGTLSRRRAELALTDKGYYFGVILMREFFTGVNNLRQNRLALDT